MLQAAVVGFLRIGFAVVALSLSWERPLPAVEFPARDIQIDTPVTAVPNNSTRPALNVDPNDNVYVVWQDNRNGPESILFNHRFPEGDWEPRSVSITTGNPRSQDVDQGDATTPQLCSDSLGHIYAVWVDNRSVKAGTGLRDIYMRYSKDFGVSWLPEFIDYRVDTDTPNPGDSVGPQIACDGDGRLYVVWLDDKDDPGRYAVYFRSIQVTFQTPVDTIQPLQFPDVKLNVGEKDKPVTEGSFTALTPRIAADGLGSVYVAWEDSREQADKEIFPGIYFNASHDHGASWKANDLRVDHRPPGFFRSAEPRIAADRLGGVHVIWLDNAGRPIQQIDAAGRNKLFYNHSMDFGNTWQETDTYLSNIPKTSEVQNATIAVDDKRGVYAAWTDNSGGAVAETGDQTSTTTTSSSKFHVFFNHSENSGFTWLDFTDRIRLDPGNTSSDAQNLQIVSDAIRNVFVAWEDSRDGFRNIYFNYSPDHGRRESWLPSDLRVDNPASRGNSTGVRMGTDGKGQVHIAWADDRNAFGTSDIYDNNLLFDTSTLIKGSRTAEACFIATAAYGSPLEPHVLLLRQFRDRYLLPHAPGQWFVGFYYRHSPPIAGFLNRHPVLKPAVRTALLPMIGLAGLCLQTTPLEKGAILLLLAGGVALAVMTRRNSTLP